MEEQSVNSPLRAMEAQRIAYVTIQLVASALPQRWFIPVSKWSCGDKKRSRIENAHDAKTCLMDPSTEIDFVIAYTHAYGKFMFQEHISRRNTR